jgi:hypothetical protein
MAKDPSLYENIQIPELGGLTLAQARQIAASINAAIDNIKATLQNPTARYSASERGIKAAQAGFNDEEEKAIHAVFDAADIVKKVIEEDMAGKDHGNDPNALEIDLQRARIEVYKVFRKAGENVLEFGYALIDTAISTALLARDVESDLYAVVKGLATVNTKVRSALADAYNFFRGRVKREKNETK